MTITVHINELYQDGSSFALSREGNYTLEVRAWGDNDFDTGAFEVLDIEVINPCLLEQVQAPDSPLDQQIYYIIL